MIDLIGKKEPEVCKDNVLHTVTAPDPLIQEGVMFSFVYIKF